MSDLFMDTSGWACYAIRAEVGHEDAVTFIRLCLADRGRLITTNYILTEVVALLGRLNVPRSRMISFFDQLYAAPDTEFIHVDTNLHERAWMLLKDRPDRSWSLVDCASFVIMEDRGLTAALATDHHFEQAGFTRLLRP